MCGHPYCGQGGQATLWVLLSFIKMATVQSNYLLKETLSENPSVENFPFKSSVTLVDSTVITLCAHVRK